MVAGSKNISKPKDLKIVVIDHHATNNHFGQINLIDPNISSTAELATA
jgi:nanoRNase/pAp phosphatase (c-di-AMP/oligoRNAs hydrolase)